MQIDHLSPSTRPRGLRVSVVGLEFGSEFVPIYRDHPHVEEVAVCDLRETMVDSVGEAFGISRSHQCLDEVLEDPDIDAVHLVTGLHEHADQVVAALDAGKHVACTVPMALQFDDIERIVDARSRSGKNYMMMETAVFTREYFYVRDMVNSGRMGHISYARGTHYQDMTGWPSYWAGLPPMFYATHAVSPILSLLNTSAKSVRAMGGGKLLEQSQGDYGNPFPLQAALVQLHDSDALVEVARSLYQVARSYTESFSLYGATQSFEWSQLEASGEGHVIFEMGPQTIDGGRPVTARRVQVPDYAHGLPEAIRGYSHESVHDTDGSKHRSFVQGNGHGGSHPHLVHEFVSSIVEERPPSVDEIRAANWTATGIAAHESAMRAGDRVTLPSFLVNRTH